MKKIIILLMAVSIMLTSCGKSAGLSNGGKKADNKSPLAGSDKKNLPQNTKGFWHTATNFLWDYKIGLGLTALSLFLLSVAIYYRGDILGLFKKNGATSSLPSHPPLTTIKEYIDYQHDLEAEFLTQNEKLVEANKEIKILAGQLNQALKDADNFGRKFNEASSNVNSLLKQRTGLQQDNQILSDKLKQRKQEAEDLLAQNALLLEQIKQLQAEHPSSPPENPD